MHMRVTGRVRGLLCILWGICTEASAVYKRDLVHIEGERGGIEHRVTAYVYRVFAYEWNVL